MVIYPVGFLKALADETRVRMLNLLLFHEFNVNELVTILNMGQSRISRHLKILADSGIVSSRRDGLWVFYAPCFERPGGDFLKDIEKHLIHEPHFQMDKKAAEEVLREAVKKTTSFFNSVAKDWEKLRQGIIGSYDIGEIVSTAMDDCSTAVDLGCGTGDLLPVLLKKAKTVIGVDNSSNMLKIAKENLKNRNNSIQLRLGELEHLPLKNDEADFAVINMVLHHLSSPETAIREIWRVLKNGDKLLCIDFEKHSDESFRKVFGDRRLGFEIDEIRQLFIKSGFSIKTVSSFPLPEGRNGLILIVQKRET